MKLHYESIRQCLVGKKELYKGFTFQYITKQEFNSIKQNPLTNHLAFGDYFISTEEPTNKNNIKL